MNKFEFDMHFIEHLDIGLLYILISAIIVFIFLKKHIYSIFDPLFFMMILGTCAYSTVFYLYHFNFINDYYFYSFIFTQLLFFIGFILNKPITKKDFANCNKVFITHKATPAIFIYMFSSFLFVITQLIVYYVSGIPLLMASRLEIFTGGSGYEFLGRIIYVTSIISLSFAIYRILFIRKKIIHHLWDYFIIVFSLLVAVLSGGKAAILSIIFIMFLTTFFSRKITNDTYIIKKINKIGIIFFLMAVPASLFTIYVQSGLENINEIVISLALRFIHTGDIFFMSLPYDVLNQLNINANGFEALFKSILGAFRIVEWSDLPINLGLQVFGYHHDTDLITGPNARHNIFGLFYFGFWGSMLFSFLLGFIFGFVRNTLYKKLKPTESNMIIYTLLVMSINYIGQDPSGQALDYLFSTLLIYFPLYTISIILFKLSKVKKIKELN